MTATELVTLLSPRLVTVLPPRLHLCVCVVIEV